MSRQKDMSRLEQLVRRKYEQRQNWDDTMADAQKAVYKEILEGWRSLEEAKDHLAGMPGGSVMFTARGDEISFSLVRIILEHIEKNPQYSPWEKTGFTPSVKWEQTGLSKRRTHRPAPGGLAGNQVPRPCGAE